jgi:hypothetical protein
MKGLTNEQLKAVLENTIKRVMEESMEESDEKDFDGKPFGDDDGDDKPNVLDREPKNADVQENKNESLKEGYETKMSCEMKGGKWHEKEGICSFGDEHQRPGQLGETFTSKKDQLLFERLTNKWAK